MFLMVFVLFVFFLMFKNCPLNVLGPLWQRAWPAGSFGEDGQRCAGNRAFLKGSTNKALDSLDPVDSSVRTWIFLG